MTSIQDSKFGQLIWFYILDKLNSHLFQSGSFTIDKVVFHHPLYEWLTKDRIVVLDPICCLHKVNFFPSRFGSNAINHAIGEADMFLNPSTQVWVLQFGQTTNDVTSRVSIVRNVITTNDRKRSHTSLASLTKGLHNHTNNRLRIFRMGNVMLNVWMRRVERSRRGTQIVSTFGNTGTDYFDVRVLEFLLDGGELGIVG
mmetsp:Transcript_27623/g.80051  ORF Transcript_27623/g.80051 Transcript_27623/m.80051 type:complete len:199 (+) Transcript_27623:648-1244(+)